MNTEHVGAAEASDEVDRDFAEYLWVPADNIEPVARSRGEMITIFLIICVCSSSMFETWFELNTATDNAQIAAFFVAELIWLVAGFTAVCDIRAGKIAFAILCGVSVLMDASALPSVFVVSKVIFIMLLVECLLKASCLIELCGRYLAGYPPEPHAAPSAPETNRYYGSGQSR